MYVDKVSIINFREDKKRYVSNKTMQNAQKLLQKMNNNTKYVENPRGTTFTSDILASVNLGDNVRFVDQRFFLAPTDKQILNCPDSSLYIGDKYVTFNSVNGEIFKYKKGFFSTFHGFLSDIDKNITILTEYFNNFNVVTKNRLLIKGFTQKGLNIFKNSTK